MENVFYNGLRPDDAFAAEKTARLIFELRENRSALLRAHGVDDEARLLDAMRAARLPEHPIYECYLSARILERTRQMLRHALAAHLATCSGAQASLAHDVPAPVITPPQLRDALQALIGPRLAAINVNQDALGLRLDNGTAVELRLLSADEYSFAWEWGTARLRIDTAPLFASFSHLHTADGRTRADPLTLPGRDPLENIHALLKAILHAPLLDSDRASNP